MFHLRCIRCVRVVYLGCAAMFVGSGKFVTIVTKVVDRFLVLCVNEIGA